MTIQEKILKASEELPEAVQVELLDFAEFLCQRYQGGKVRGATVGDSLTTLCGGLEKSQTFGGEPVDIQRGLRDEWD
jgi:hypothetical protein